MRALPFIYVCLVLINSGCSSCGKKDIITVREIRGTVMNNCTDSGIANVRVILQTFKNEGLFHATSVVSAQDGSFLFPDAKIHSDTRFSYALHIDTRSGTAAQTPEHAGFTGTTMYFTSKDIGLHFQPRVTPKYLWINFQFTKVTPLSISDSLTLHFNQPVFRKNVPHLPGEFWGLIRGDKPFSIPGGSGGYPMGLWRIKREKWVNSVHTIELDSLYLQAAKAYTYAVTW